MKIFIILLILVIPTLVFSQISLEIKLLSPSLGYCEQYQGILEIPTNEIEWQVNAIGPDRENATYRLQIHMANHRSCGVVFNKRDVSWQAINGETFKYRGMAGCYYIGVKAELNDKVYDKRLYIHCKVLLIL